MKNFSDHNEILNNTSLIDTFVELVKVDTISVDTDEKIPSTDGQWTLLKMLKEKLIQLGLTDAVINEKGFLFATLPTNQKQAKIIGFVAHVDTSPEFSGKDVNPQFHKNYQGQDIALKNNITISTSEYPELKTYIGDTIITADGTTLLGADDKAGIAEILATLEYLKQHPEIPRPTLRIAFTPDEETGNGAGNFDIKTFNAECAYTIDGNILGDLCYETFSAKKGVITIIGQNTHPGSAKNKMVSAIKYAGKFIEALPQNECPECTEGYQGFFHPYHIEGSVAQTTITFLLRDFEEKDLDNRDRVMRETAEKILKQEPRLQIKVDITKSYSNMKYFLKDSPEVFEKAKQAMLATGIEPLIQPIRGGTDGSVLSEKGLPTPNLFAGFRGYHGPKEWISTRVMGLAVCNILNLIQIWTQ